MRNVLAIVLGGGQGSRLYPLTKLRAKPAVPIAGKYRLIDIPVSNSINSGIQKIYVLTQFNSASLNRHITLTYQFGPLSGGFVEVLAAQQTQENKEWFQGTADAVRQCMVHIRELKISDILILSGDHLYRMDYHNFISEHRETGADITIPVLGVEEEKASSFGLLKINDTNEVLEFQEKPKGDALKAMQVDTTILGLNEEEAKQRPYIASMGIYAFKRDALIKLLDDHPDQLDFGKEIIPSAIKEKDVKTYLYDDYWEDIGTIGSFFEANLGLLKEPAPNFSFYEPDAPIFTRQRFLPPSKIIDSKIDVSMISEGCLVYNSTIKESLLGIRSRVAPGCHIERTLIMGVDYLVSEDDRKADIEQGGIPIGIGKNCVIKNAIVDKNARIGDNVRITNEKNVQELDQESKGYYIRDGVVVVLKNATIEPGTVI